MKKNILFILIWLTLLMVLAMCNTTDNNKTNPLEMKTSEINESKFITVKNGQFIKQGKPYYYIGANFWYGVNLAADAIGGDRERLISELDFLKSNGVDNLRILVGAEGPDNSVSRVSPTMYNQDGTLNQKLLEGMDYLLVEMAKREIYGVFYLTNNWEWSGGMAQYLDWNGYGEMPNPNLEKYSWDDFNAYQKQFYSCEPCIKQVENFITKVISRTNSINGIKYTDDPTIMAWQLANEPRPMASDNFEPFTAWIKNTAALIKKLDSNHLVSTGNEGEKGCSEDFNLYKTINKLEDIDYITIHAWVKNWGWYNHEKAEETFPEAMKTVDDYIKRHVDFATEIKKPVVLEEFGIGRDNESFNPDSPTTYRDKYYKRIFDKINKSYGQSGMFAGINFWAFGGFAKPIDGQKFWKLGDALMGDPPQEEQGLNCVFATDTSTMKIIKYFNTEIGNL